ncbi:MAG: hypothetical protein Kow00122_19760 [Thermoleophilia bacterium]
MTSGKRCCKTGYWGAAGATGAAAAVAYLAYLRPRHLKWGTQPGEPERLLPGDEVIAKPKQTSTRAVDVAAARAAVWPWLAQIGQGRGGFYSYDRLENLFGCDIHSANRVLPEHQELRPGDRIRLGPEGHPFYTVRDLEEGHWLLLEADAPEGEEPPIAETWLFHLEELSAKRTRLTVRNRRDYDWGVKNFLLWKVLTEPAHFIMERKMLLGIRRRAEQKPL